MSSRKYYGRPLFRMKPRSGRVDCNDANDRSAHNGDPFVVADAIGLAPERRRNLLLFDGGL